MKTSAQPTAVVALIAALAFGAGSPTSNNLTTLPESEYPTVSKNFGKLAKGMSSQQVEQFIGPPSSTNNFNWMWRFTNIGDADEEVFVVFFTNGVLDVVNHARVLHDTSDQK